MDHEELNKNQIVFDAVMMNFIVIGEAVSRLTEGFTNDNSHIDWNKIKGLRNIIAHDYFGIDAEEIWQIINNVMPEFEKQIRKI